MNEPTVCVEDPKNRRIDEEMKSDMRLTRPLYARAERDNDQEHKHLMIEWCLCS